MWKTSLLVKFFIQNLIELLHQPSQEDLTSIAKYVLCYCFCLCGQVGNEIFVQWISNSKFSKCDSCSWCGLGNAKTLWRQGATVCGCEIEGRIPSKGSGKGNLIYIVQCCEHEMLCMSQINVVFLPMIHFCVCLWKMAAVAALCVQYEAEFRPNMSIVVKALPPLLNARSSNHTKQPPNL